MVQSEMVEALKTLSSHFLDRVGEGEGATWLGEQIVRCYHGKASDEVSPVSWLCDVEKLIHDFFLIRSSSALRLLELHLHLISWCLLTSRLMSH